MGIYYNSRDKPFLYNNKTRSIQFKDNILQIDNRKKKQL